MPRTAKSVAATVTEPIEDIPGLDPKPARGRYFVEALGRGLEILDCFTTGTAQLSLGEISERVGLGRGTTFRLLRTLEEAGYIYQNPTTKQYMLTLKIFDLQGPSVDALGYPEIARPFLEELNRTIGEAVYLAIYDGISSRNVIRMQSKRIISVTVREGVRLPTHATANGKLILATLPEEKVRSLYKDQVLEACTSRTITTIERLVHELEAIRRSGYALNDEEAELGLCSVAAPIRIRGGRVIAAINILTPTGRVSREQLLGEYLPRLLQTANDISSALGYQH